VEADAPSYELSDEGPASVLEAIAVASGDALTLFAVNRGAHALPVEAVVRDAGGLSVAEHLVLADDDPLAVNTAESPDRVLPRAVPGARLHGDVLHASLPPRSWNVIRLQT
jgi:alpha-N-arabinofuranosidase